MNLSDILSIVFIIALSLTPLSLILIQLYSKVFTGHNASLATTSTIVTSLTGTLTKDLMTVQSLMFDKYNALFEEDSLLVSLEDKETKEELRVEKKLLYKEDCVKYMAIATAFCHFDKTQNLERILSEFFEGCSLNKKQLLDKYEVIAKIPSNETKKLSSVVIIDKQSKEIFSFVKGQAQTILKRCSRTLKEGKKTDIDQKLRHKLKKDIDKLNENGQKTIAFAFKALPFKKLNTYSESFVENDLVLLGTAGMADIINKDLSETIEELKSKNIKIYLLSDTKAQKSIAIGHELKITKPKYFESIGGNTLKDMSDEQIAKLFSNKEKDYTFYLLDHNDRQRIIDILSANGEVVALCDGNEGQDLKNILIAINKEQHKKNSYPKLLLHSLTCKIIESFIAITALLMGAPLPLSIALILSMDIGINLLLEISLRIEKDINLTALPSEINENGRLILNGVFGGIITVGVYIWSLMRYGWTPGNTIESGDIAILKSTTLAFVVLCLIQIINAQNFKNDNKSIFKSNPLSTPYLSLISLLLILLIYIFTSFNIFQNLLGTVTLSFSEWKIVSFGAMLLIITEEIRKYANSKT